jgi:hypothetical protein
MYRDAVGSLPDRTTVETTGVSDLFTLTRQAANLGQAIDRDLIQGDVNVLTSKDMLVRALDPTKQLGPRALQRINAAHDVQLAGAISACEPMRFGILHPPAGGTITTWTTTTTLPRGVPGVAVLENGVRTRTWITYSIVGGEWSGAYSNPILIEPAIDPTHEVALSRQALEIAVRGRELVRRYCSTLEPSGVRVGIVPILIGTIRTARYDHATGSILGPRVAPADLPEIVEALDALTDEEVPFLAQACAHADGTLHNPPGWFLELRSLAGDGAERPGSAHGLTGRTYRVVETLLESRPSRGIQVLKRIPDVAGVARISLGAVVAPGTSKVVRMRAVSHVSTKGLAAVGVTNLPDTEMGLLHLGMAIEGFFGSATERAACRRRAARFCSRFDIPTFSMGAARRVSGITVMSFTPTVVDRVGSLAR